MVVARLLGGQSSLPSPAPAFFAVGFKGTQKEPTP